MQADLTKVHKSIELDHGVINREEIHIQAFQRVPFSCLFRKTFLLSSILITKPQFKWYNYTYRLHNVAVKTHSKEGGVGENDGCGFWQQV